MNLSLFGKSGADNSFGCWPMEIHLLAILECKLCYTGNVHGWIQTTAVKLKTLPRAYVGYAL